MIYEFTKEVALGGNGMKRRKEKKIGIIRPLKTRINLKQY